MGVARRAGSGQSRWTNWINARNRAANTPGVPVPGTGVRHYHKRRSGSNKAGTLTHCNMEWGGKARKREDRQRNTNNRARREAIQDQEE